MRQIKPTNQQKRKSKPSSLKAAQGTSSLPKEHPQLQEILRQVMKVSQLKEDLLAEAVKYCEDNGLSLEDVAKALDNVHLKCRTDVKKRRKA